MTPSISTLVKKFRLRNDRVISIRSGKIAGTARPDGNRYIYIGGRLYKYSDIYATLKDNERIAKPLYFPVSMSRSYRTLAGDSVRIYAIDGGGTWCVHGAINYSGEWHAAQWTLNGAHATQSELTLVEV